ncbi:AraC family transcriptional regulator [Amphibacillus sp. Q70]|uniref:helix-turn-helix transcriptional regulator n=1 Tax=Amphibacillus sp. Q70 TaxID=3453416 RepID=UPI003F826843
MVFFEKHGVEEKEFFRYFSLTDHHFPLHFHRAYELIFVKSGELLVTIDQTVYHLKQNQLTFIFSNHIHEFKTIDQSEIVIILFSPELIGDFFTQYKGLSPNNPVLELKELPNLAEFNSIYKQKSFIYQICASLIDQTDFSKVEQSTKTKVLHGILLYVDEHYQTDCTLKDVAEYLRYDYPYLSKLFVQMTNMTFTDYLNHYRISQACYLLKNSGRPVGEIANHCGYNQLRTFHRNFKKITKQSPRAYREQV